MRSADDRLFVFAGRGQYSNLVHAYWTTAPGLPSTSADFSGTAQLTEPANILSVDAAYDGQAIVHVLVLLNNGQLYDHVFDINATRFVASVVLDRSAATVTGDYLGSSGVAGMIEPGGKLHVAAWSAGNHIIYRVYTYDAAARALTLVEGPTQVDGGGGANHPALAMSPVDRSVTVAWISEASPPARILARTRSSSGTWQSEEIASTGVLWTSRNFGANIDQGPALIIGGDGTRHLAYIENWDSTGGYGRVHYVTNSSSGWSDQALAGVYTHDPALAMAGDGSVYLLGHGHPLNLLSGLDACLSMANMCVRKMDSSGNWGPAQLVAAAPAGSSYDSSASVKWSVVGLNRPDTIEFVFFEAPAGNYNATILHYGRLN